MYKEKVGQVTEQEKNELLRLYERKLALSELLSSLNSPSLSKEDRETLYENIVADTGTTKRTMDKWWYDITKKYQWQGHENGFWSIDFDNGDIYLNVREDTVNL